MSDVFVARQPIFDKNMKLYGYELLYRRSQNNFFEGTDDDEATAALLDTSFFIGFNELIGETKGFINFSKTLLINETPLLLPPEKTVVEVLERVEITDEVVDACRKLKNAGYTLALDDFIFSEQDKSYAPMMELVDIIKLEYFPSTIKDQSKLINKHKDKITFLAERVETRQDYDSARNMGYNLFQGYFFSKPVMVQSKAIGALTNNLMMVLSELKKQEPDYKIITDIFEHDLEFSYKLLLMANSAYYGATKRITSIHQALVHIGIKELVRMVQVLLLKGVQNADNAELIKLSLIRGKLLELIAADAGMAELEPDFFLLGIFSSIDTLLGKDMESIIGKLELKEDVKDALLGKDNELRRLLNALLNHEHSRFSIVDMVMSRLGITSEKFMDLYMQALRWQQAII